MGCSLSFPSSASLFCVKDCHALSYWHLQLSLILNRAHLQTKKSTHLQIAKIQAQNTKWNTHQTRCQNEACIKHKKLTTINWCVFKSQITKSDLRTHNLKLYPKHNITRISFALEPIPN